MRYRFPVKDVVLKEVDSVPVVEKPLASGDHWQAAGTEFSLQVPEVGSFYVRDGKEIVYSIVPGG